MLAPRRIARSAVSVSPLTFGSMRMHERSLDDAAWERLLRAAHAEGITTMHSSSEYESHSRFCGVLGRMRDLAFEHVVKLAEPHFDSTSFDVSRLRAKVDTYLRELGASRIDVVQWMWRGNLKDEAGRLAGFAGQANEIRAGFEALRAEGKIGSVALFPYTAGFADAVIDAETCEALAVYLNPVEREMDPQIERAAARGMGTLAIRPLAAGKALASTTAADCVRMVLAHPAVDSAIVTFSSDAHMRELANAAQASQSER